ncbi:MAG TPA: hypothetical protein VH518_18445 [Tepidisphaeraceae bacterium]
MTASWRAGWRPAASCAGRPLPLSESLYVGVGKKEGEARRLWHNGDPHTSKDCGGTWRNVGIVHDRRSQACTTQFTRKRLSPQTGIDTIHITVIIPIALGPDHRAGSTEFAGEVGGPGPDVHTVGIAIQIGIPTVGVLYQHRRTIDGLPAEGRRKSRKLLRRFDIPQSARGVTEARGDPVSAPAATGETVLDLISNRGNRRIARARIINDRIAVGEIHTPAPGVWGAVDQQILCPQDLIRARRQTQDARENMSRSDIEVSAKRVKPTVHLERPRAADGRRPRQRLPAADPQRRSRRGDECSAARSTRVQRQSPATGGNGACIVEWNVERTQPGPDGARESSVVVECIDPAKVLKGVVGLCIEHAIVTERPAGHVHAPRHPRRNTAANDTSTQAFVGSD